MTKTKYIPTVVLTIIALTVVISLCLVGCIVSGQLIWSGCIWWECAPTRSFDTLDLGLSADLFPENAVEHPIHLSDDDNPATKRSSFQSFYWDNGNGIATYLIDPYASNRSASKNYERQKESFFSDWGETKIVWLRPKEITYNSPLADDFFIACGTMIMNDYRCGMIARYQEFVLHFNATMSEDMTYEDFHRIVIAIDEKISDYLYKK